MTIWFSNKMMIYGIGKEISMCGGSEEPPPLATPPGTVCAFL